MKVAVLGLGAMGSRVARRVLAAGHTVAVYNRTAQRCAPLVEAGAIAAETPRAAAQAQEVVISMVRDDDASRAVWLDPHDGALAAMPDGAIAVESSTLSVAWTQELHRAAQERGVSFVDAPVVGSRPQADAGTLAYLVGGEASAVDAVRPLLLASGGALHHVGPVATGMTMKLAVNAFFGVQVAAFGEVLGLLLKAGVPRRQATEVLAAMPITSPALAGVAGQIAAGDFAPLFPVELVAKDLAYALAACEQVGAHAPTTATVSELYARASAGDLGPQNISAIAKLFD